MQRNFKLAYAAKKGKIKPEELSGAARKLYNNLSTEQLEAYITLKPPENPTLPEFNGVRTHSRHRVT